MVVTRSRLAAVRYKQALDRYIAEQGYDLGVLVAFSGKVVDPDAPDGRAHRSVHERLPESQTVRRFDGDDMHLMVVAEKYQTGFDQPKLHTMYVDKKLDGVNAVQTLSRLNRPRTRQGRHVRARLRQRPEDIRESFEPYYASPSPHRPTRTCSTTPGRPRRVRCAAQQAAANNLDAFKVGFDTTYLGAIASAPRPQREGRRSTTPRRRRHARRAGR
jgi:hypothetical protein